MFDRPVSEIEIENERLRNRIGGLELQLAKATGIKPTGFEYMAALSAQFRQQEELPDYFGTWHELRCECGQRFIYNNGDIRDMTTMDVSAVKCCKCGEVKWLDYEPKPDDWREFAVESFPTPTTEPPRAGM